MKLLPVPKKPNKPQPTEVKQEWRSHLPKPSRKQIIYTAIVLVTIILVVWAFRPAPLGVDIATVRRGELQVTVNAEGKTRVGDRFVVSAPVDGRLARIKLDEGDRIEQGTVIARIDPLPLTASVKEALGRLEEWRAQREGVATQRPKAATLEQARKRIQVAVTAKKQAQAKVAEIQAALEQARRDRQRAQKLHATGAIPRKDKETAQLNEITKAKELETAKLAVKSATSEVEVARDALTVLQKEQQDPDYLLKVYSARIASVEAELEKLRDEAKRTDITSPVGGQVLRILQKSAQFVKSGTALLELGDVSQLELVIDVLSTDALKIKPGDRILISQGTEQQPLLGKVRLLEPSAFTKVSALGVEEQRVNVIGDFVDSPGSFGDAYRVDVQIVVWEAKDILQVPLSALFRCGKSWCTFVVKDGKARLRQIHLGHRSDFDAEVHQGLEAGEQVILHPTEKIDAGSRVKKR
ncbi:MAG: HlyD family efflux transporter periplasmic adaptor subunit [Nostocaceae cyanobacterium]|nr:HlyD family efflux transporter periplasmic adaptor subunit [Nostocaceae cyanobacterium]